MKKFVKILAGILCGIFVFVVTLLSFVRLTEYTPDSVERAGYITKGYARKLQQGEEFSMLTFNVGYCGLDKTEDFFMDGGKKVQIESKENVEKNMQGVKSILEEVDADITLLQEVDRNSKRTFYVDQAYFFANMEDVTSSTYATFYKSPFVPYPFTEPLGKVDAGMQVISKYTLHSGLRIDLPSAYSFPVRAFQCKRALLKQVIDVEGTDKKLVLYNLHLEAYDKNNTRAKQLEILSNMMQQDLKEGNYVIAGGDFNQRFPNADNDRYPLLNDKFFTAPIIEEDAITEDFTFACDSTSPTSRLLDKPYSGNREETQLYVIDGYIVSSNVEVTNVETLDYDFAYSDHNPVKMSFTLK